MNADQVRTTPPAAERQAERQVEQDAANRGILEAADAVAEVLAEHHEPGFSAQASGDLIPLGLALLRRFCIIACLRPALLKQASSRASMLG
jgi:hypothetical protein